MKRWYVIQVYAGYEEAVKADVLKRVRDEKLEEYFGQMLVPSAKMKQFFESGDTKDQQLFPGYVLIEMEADSRLIRAVNLNPRVLRFLGGKEPVALSAKEVDRILAQMKGEVVFTQEATDYSVGQEVEICDGPFTGFVGIIERVDRDSEKLTVMVSIFGRMTPVELAFNQVKQ